MIMGETNIDGTALQAPVIPTYNPPRNFDLDSSTLIHEYGHGVTNR